MKDQWPLETQAHLFRPPEEFLALPRDRQFLCPKQPGTHAHATSSSLILLQFNGLHTILYKPQTSPVLPNAFNEDEDP